MPTPQTKSRTVNRIRSKARGELLAQLKDDHQRVKKAYTKFRKLDAVEDAAQRRELVNQVLDELNLHTQLEEELLYPAARDAIAEPALIDEAEVEHEMLRLLMEQLRARPSDDAEDSDTADRDARFTVLCEYTLHHVKEEEREMFPQLVKAKLDWPALLSEFVERRSTMSPSFSGDGQDAGPQSTGMQKQQRAARDGDGGSDDDKGGQGTAGGDGTDADAADADVEGDAADRSSGRLRSATAPRSG